jgi:hypothetical protein
MTLGPGRPQSSAGKPGFSYYYGVGGHKTSVGLWIDRGKDAAKETR